jgi:hypothetical protein
VATHLHSGAGSRRGVVLQEACQAPESVRAGPVGAPQIFQTFGTFAVLGNHEHDAHRSHMAGDVTPPASARVLNRHRPVGGSRRT